MYANILVPVDGSETSKLALEEAIRLARSQGSRLRLLHVVNEYVFDDPCAPSALTGSVIESLREGGQKILAEAQARVAREGVDCDVMLLESLGGPCVLLQCRSWWCTANCLSRQSRSREPRRSGLPDAALRRSVAASAQDRRWRCGRSCAQIGGRGACRIRLKAAITGGQRSGAGRDRS